MDKLGVDLELRRLEAEYRRQGKLAAANHVQGCRVLLEKARRLAEAGHPALAKYAMN